jgi:Tfp pilus assembly protein PilO
MKLLSRDFTIRERVLIGLLGAILVILCYYQFVDQPVRTAINSANAEKQSLQMELETVEAKVAMVNNMENELDDIAKSGAKSKMESYNNSKAELALLNDILASATDYSITFAEVRRDGDQIRRDFSLQFTAPNYQTVEDILADLARSPYRCLVGDISCSSGARNVSDSTVSVSATATFYETMVGGTADAGLPADTTAENEEGITYDDLAG